ncbi:hypothetical protein ABIB25_003587 [Nakamurella sp. UYEF19]|uniref:DUF2142 domain-containing protein n=1 Tax=Nakamurella sp. UYEF19 TaxID=1756392 RepID=UPI0033983C6F
MSRSGHRAGGHWGSAGVFVVPYLILMLSWAFSNPPGAAPDEPDHLVKAIGMSSFDIGSKYTGAAVGNGGIGQQRNASISRVITVPGNLAPVGYTCYAFRTDTSAACLSKTTTSTTSRDVVDPLGSYPAFLYVPMGWVTALASTPTQAFLLVRLFCALVCSLLLLLGAAHLVRGLGRRALLGAFVGLTPMVVFSSSVVTTSGFEICAAFAVACVVVVGLRRPETLAESGTQLLLAGAGGTLILSRQLGAVTFALLMLLLLVRVGPAFFLRLLRAHRPALVSAVGILALCGVAVLVWERAYDHPSMVGSALSGPALGSFALKSYSVLESGVAQFGWLDTAVPPWVLALWIMLGVLLIGAAALLAPRSDRLTMLVWFLLLLLIAYFTYATVFFTVDAGLQGRHLLAFFQLIPLLAGVVLVERLDQLDSAVTARFFTLVAVVMPVVQVISLYVNARRYAVGSAGPVWFLPAAAWEPPLGWWPWLLLGLIGAVWLGRNIIMFGSMDATKSKEKEMADVER